MTGVAWLALQALRGQTGPEACKPGFVWREATGPNDHVCVTPATRAQAARDNSQANARKRPGGGPLGPDTCKAGLVWREAIGPQDHVCVSPATRDQAAADNAVVASRFLNPPVLWDVLTQHNDPQRTGAQLHETTLKPANVTPSTFGRLYERTVEGQVISQPLYVSNQWIPGRGLKDVVYVATRNNVVYAFDADDLDPDPSHPPIWVAPDKRDKDGTQLGLEPAADANLTCGETHGPMGITSTPVIDRASDTMYLTARNKGGPIWLYALDLATGKPKKGTPGKIKVNVKKGAVKNSKGEDVFFDSSLQLQRTGLLFQDGAIYLAFSALNCDNPGHPEWHGWVLAYRAPDLTLVGAYVTTPNHGSTGGGIWQSGNGLVGDGAGNIYFETGNNGPNEANGPDLGESFVKLHHGPHPLYGTLTVAASYTVSNFNWLNSGDTDLGSGGPTLLPGNLLVGGGKQGKLYVLEVDHMCAAQNPAGNPPQPCRPAGTPFEKRRIGGRWRADGSDGFQAFSNSWHAGPHDVECTDGPFILGRRCFVTPDRYALGELFGPNIHGGPVYWDAANQAFGLLYGMPEKDYLKSFRYNKSTHKLATTSKQSAVRSPDGMPGSHLSLSANGSADGIIWASVPKYDAQTDLAPGSLVAFDALTLKELWRDDDDIAYAKFNPPTVAGGKVFRPTFANKLLVYGLRTTPATTPCYTIAQKYQNYAKGEGILGGKDGPPPETTAPDGGRFAHFPRGSIYWTPSTCAHETDLDIDAKWKEMGYERSPLGYPVTDKTVTPDGIGRFNHFQHGSIYWTPLTGAHGIVGAIRDRWASMGWERGTLGYPISDVTADPKSDPGGFQRRTSFSLFEHGSIHWDLDTNAITVHADANILVGPGHVNTDRPGSNISNFDLPEPNVSLCQQRCADNASCRAWSYVKPGVQGPKARCWLKNAIPLERGDACCTSGLKVDVRPSNMNAPVANTDQQLQNPSANFANFDLPTADYRLCQGECARNGTCRAWTYVEPGLQGPQARCWLKNDALQTPEDQKRCISGSKNNRDSLLKLRIKPKPER